MTSTRLTPTYNEFGEGTLETRLRLQVAKEVIACLQVLGRQELQEQHVEAAQTDGLVDLGPWSNVLRGRVEAELEEIEDGENGYDGDDPDDSVFAVSPWPVRKA